MIGAYYAEVIYMDTMLMINQCSYVKRLLN